MPRLHKYVSRDAHDVLTSIDGQVNTYQLTPAGEGKSTVSVGLAQALRRIGENAVLCIREPSLGPVFGVKGGAAYGATDEWHQSFVPGRETELGDWVADATGAAVALLLYRRWSWYRTLLEKPLIKAAAK